MIFYIGITINVLSVQNFFKNEAPHIHLVSWAQVTFKPHVDVLDRPLPKLRDSRCINVITFSIIQIILPRNTLDHKSIQLMTPVHLELSGHGTVIEVAGTIIRNMITGYCLSFFLAFHQLIWLKFAVRYCPLKSRHAITLSVMSFFYVYLVKTYISVVFLVCESMQEC